MINPIEFINTTSRKIRYDQMSSQVISLAGKSDFGIFRNYWGTILSMFANLPELSHIQNLQSVIVGGSAFQRPLYLDPSRLLTISIVWQDTCKFGNHK
jgi:hypothetical protein